MSYIKEIRKIYKNALSKKPQPIPDHIKQQIEYAAKSGKPSLWVKVYQEKDMYELVKSLKHEGFEVTEAVHHPLSPVRPGIAEDKTQQMKDQKVCEAPFYKISVKWN